MAVKKSTKLIWSVLLICVLGAVGAFFYLRQSPAPARAPGGMPMATMPPVRIAEAILQNVPYFLNGLGTVVPSSDVLVQSRVEGQLIRIHFKDGQRVKAGDLLAEIDPRPFQAALEQARGTLARDKAQLQNAQRDLARYAKLARGDFIAGQQYESQKALVTQYKGTVEADQAAVDSAALQVEYSKIKAPVGGRLGLRVVDEGNQIKANDPDGIVRITETQPCDVLFTLPENRISLVTRAFMASEKNPAYSPPLAEAWDREQKELLAEGELISIDNQIDSSTGTIKLKARFSNLEHKLFPNQFVNVRLLVNIFKDVVTVPDAALQLGARGSYCYVIGEEKAGQPDIGLVEYREVTPGISTEGVQVIDKGIKAGEKVVVDGVDRLRNDIEARIAATVPTPHVSIYNTQASVNAEDSVDEN